MTTLNRQVLQKLVEFRADHCVSVYMPTHRTGRERQQDEIRIKNLHHRAVESLMQRGLDRSTAEGIAQPIQDIKQDEAFWSSRSDGLAMFASEGQFHAYRCPESFSENLVLAGHYHVTPLLPLLQIGGRFYVLTLEHNAARLFEATRESIAEVDLPTIKPIVFDGAEEALQYHSHRAPTKGKGKTSEAIFHGHGAPDDREKRDLKNYFDRVDRAIQEVLHVEDTPMILACVDYLAPIYEQANSYRSLVEQHVSGNPSAWSESDLREKAWTAIRPHFEKQLEDARRKFEEAAGSDRAAEDLREVVLAARDGRVDTLFVARSKEVWGRVDAGMRAVHIEAAGKDSPDGEELLDYAALETMNHGGSVYSVDETPTRSGNGGNGTHSPAVALLRF